MQTKRILRRVPFLSLLAVFAALPACLGNLREALDPCAGGACALPPCTGFSWIVKAVHCEDTLLKTSCAGITDLVIDPSATPPQARMSVGEAARVELSPINPMPPNGACVFNPGGFSFVSSNPAAARIEKTTINTDVTIRAEGPGDAEILADGVSTPTGPVRAPLAYCADSRQGAACVPIPLILRVLR
jgi:hypothetical protein